MSEFKREPRYIVVKIKDIEAAGCTQSEIDAFNALCDKVFLHRALTGKPPLECVVVEHDWGIYQYVWDLVRAEATGEPIQSVKLPTTVEEAKAMIRVGSASLQGFAVTECAAKGHDWVLSQVAGEGYTCGRCKAWKSEEA